MDDNAQIELKKKRAMALRSKYDSDFLLSSWSIDTAVSRVIDVEKYKDEYKNLITRNDSSINGKQKNIFEDIEKFYSNLKSLALDNIESKKLPILTAKIPDNEKDIKVDPRNFLHWAKKLGFHVDEALAKLGDLQPISETQNSMLSVEKKKDSSKRQSGACSLPMPKGVKWKDVSIKFRNGNDVTVQVGDKSKKSNYAEMGMSDGRNSSPTKAWHMLKILADQNGVIPKSKKESVSTTISALRKALKGYFGLDDDPIPFSSPDQEYKAKFQIKPETDLESTLRNTNPDIGFTDTGNEFTDIF